MRPGLRALIALLCVLGSGATLGATIGAAARPHHRLGHVKRRCHPRRHHRCPQARKPPARRKAPSRKAPAPTSTTTTTSTTSTTSTSTTSTTSTSTTSTTPALPSRLEVDENDQGPSPQPYSLTPSHNPVAAGVVQFNVYNFGQDAHTFAVVNSAHQQLALVNLPAGALDAGVPVSVDLPAGTYTLVCTLAGHATLGMHATLTVK